MTKKRITRSERIKRLAALLRHIASLGQGGGVGYPLTVKVLASILNVTLDSRHRAFIKKLVKGGLLLELTHLSFGKPQRWELVYQMSEAAVSRIKALSDFELVELVEGVLQ